MKYYSTREMINYSRTRRKKNIIGFQTCLDLVEAFVNIFDGALEMSFLFACKARYHKFMCWMVLGMDMV